MSSSNTPNSISLSKKDSNSKNGVHYTPIDQTLDLDLSPEISEKTQNVTDTPVLDFQATYKQEKELDYQISNYFDVFRFILLVFTVLDIWLAITSPLYYTYVGFDVLAMASGLYGVYLRSPCHIKIFIALNFKLWIAVNVYLVVVASNIKSNLDLIHFLTYSLVFGFVYNVMRFLLWMDASRFKNFLAPRTVPEAKTVPEKQGDRKEIQLDEITWK